MRTLEEELIERIMQLDEIQQQQVLDFIDMIERGDNAEKHYTAKDFMKLAPAERERIAKEALLRSLGGYFEDQS